MRGDSVHLKTFWGGILSGVFFHGGLCPGGIMSVLPQKTNTFQTWNLLCEFGSVFLFISFVRDRGAVSENCTL